MDEEKHNAKYLGGDINYSYGTEKQGLLFLTPKTVCFQGRKWTRFEGYSSDIKLEIPINRMEDVKSFTEKESSMVGLHVIAGFSLVGKTKHKKIEITYRDDKGILQHPIFESDYAESLVRRLYSLRIKNTTESVEK